ncbi:hypothetical protein HMPREF9154_2867 [Arachnia propionica F0230a]|nr:hypothetical protein HMPREF9154_2867 [Arachnia propionica F0230a]
MFAGLDPSLLGLFKFAGLTAQANVNKPSKTTGRPANRVQGQQTEGRRGGMRQPARDG